MNVFRISIIIAPQLSNFIEHMKCTSHNTGTSLNQFQYLFTNVSNIIVDEKVFQSNYIPASYS